MGKIVETRKLYKETIDNITKTEENWLNFLDSSSWHFKYNFVDKILIYAQRPDATACAEMEEEWNKKCKRWVNKNANGIFVLSKDDNSPYPFRIVFDVSDTHNARGTDYKLWSVKPEYEERIIETLETTFGGECESKELSENIIANAYNMVTDNIQDYLSAIYENRQGTIFETLSKEEVNTIITLTVWASVSYLMMKRCGINAREKIDIKEFNFIKDFNNSKIITALGTAISDIAEVGIREIAKTVRNIEIEEKNINHTFVKKEKEEYSNNKEINNGGIKNGENRIHESRRLQHTKFSDGERKDTQWEIRKNEATLSKDSKESRIFDIIDGQGIEQRIDRNSKESNRNDKSDSRETSKEGWNNRRNESQRTNEMDRTNEQLQNDSRRTGNQGANLQLDLDELAKQNENIINELPTEEEQKQIIAGDETSSVFSFTQEMIDNVLKEGSHFENGKFRIYEYLTRGLSSKENADFLKQEYGIGGRSSDENGISVDYNSKGIKIYVGYEENAPTLLLNWKQVEKRIRELINADRYFNEQEKDKYFDWLDANGIKNSNNELNQNIYDEDYELSKRLHSFIKDFDWYSYIDNVPIENTDEENIELIRADINDELNIKDYIDFLKRCIEDIDYDDEVAVEARYLLVELERRLPYYEFHKGDIVYIGTNEYEIRAINEERVVLVDTSFPILTKEMERKDFDKKVKENPANDKLRTGKRIQDKIQEDNTNKEKEISKNIETKEIEQEHSKSENKSNEELKPNIKRKRKNKIEYFDLHPEIPLSERNNFKINDDDLGVGSKKEKYQSNIEAIRILKQCEEQNKYATKEEQEILSKYVGWGGIPEAFDSRNDNWHKEYEELKAILTEKEYEEARKSTLTAFYTPPVVIRAMYKALENMGLKRGNILEPSCGTGNFMGMIPDTLKECKMYGVEIDSISGRIASQLYQKNTIAVKGYEDVELPDSFFDIGIGNVPFGDFKPYDKRYDKNKFLIHDYFFAKTLDKVRPNGVIAFITSKGTLDKKDESVRKYISQRAELIGAIRLPNNTFKKNAGTEVTTDIIFLKKRDKITDIEDEWVQLDTNEDGIQMNKYYIEHPEMILGKMELETTQYGMDSTCKPLENSNFEELLNIAIQNLNAEIEDYQIDMIDDEEISIPADPSVRNFSYTIVDEQIYYRENSQMYLQELPITTINRIKSMIAIRDCVRELIEVQLDDGSDEEIERLQARLNGLYDNFTKNYGLINSSTNERAFSEDSSYFLLCSLEILNENRQFVRKADMFSKRTIKPHRVISRANNCIDALILSISEKAKVDMEYIQKLTGKSEEEIVKELEGSIYKDPIKEEYVTADEYLSGNVREKLKIAKKFAENNSEYETNVKALEQVKIKDLTASEISVRLGATWIPPSDIEDFMFELLETSEYKRDRIQVYYSEYTSDWNISGKSEDNGNVRAYNTYGTKRINAYRIIESTLNLKDVRIYDTVIDIDGKEKRVLNAKETAIAQSKQELIKNKFEEWIWKDQARRERLVTYYNEHFNNIRPREYDGQYITFGGMNPEITLRKHQLNAVAHALYGGNTLLAHEVGAGKTFEMIAIAMESKRIGLCNKSLFVVPNHIIEQFASEFLQLYPSANILVATKKDFATNNRKKFCSKIATGEYDAIIIGHSQFEKIPMSKERQIKILQKQVSDLTLGINDLKNSDGEYYSIKQLEKSKEKVEEKLKRLNDQSRKDDVITFEQLGCDRLFVDEAHYFKNLFLYTKMRNVGGIAQTEAQKSSDLFMKCQYLDELTGGKGIVFATGTPISNSMVEMYTMQRYLQYKSLEERGLVQFDAWATTFGETVTAIELSPEGTGYRAKTRFAKFYNLPELMSMFKEIADIQTAETLNLPVPKANFHSVVVKPSDIQKEMVAELGERAERIRKREVDSKTDNMLKITNEGRKLALDQRILNDMLPDFEGSKVNICANNIYDIWNKTATQKSTQLVFCDLSTPNNDGKFNVYDDLKQKLINKGIPENEIAFIHQANTETRKKELFAKVRVGDVRVLIGSTAKMGAGTNVQNKIKAIHHLDCPWRPADLTQRNGRGIRQGNENDEIDVYTYVTEGTFDAYLYQLVENKQKFISQIMTSKAIVRSAEDIDEKALSYAEIKALAAGNPLIIEKTELDTEVSKLKLLKQSYLNQKYALEDAIVKVYPVEIKRNTDLITNIEKDIETVNQNTKTNSEEKFSPMILNEKIYNKKEDAGKMILEICNNKETTEQEEIGKYRGMKMYLEIVGKNFVLTLQNQSTYAVNLGKDVYGNISRIDNLIANMEDKLDKAKIQLENLKQQFENAKKDVKVPFDKEQELQEKLKRLNQVNKELEINDKENEIIDDVPETEKEEKKSQEYNKEPIR